ncbi:hypothetical protein PCE1_004625 [Barthelona sp. PCE]
MNSSMSTSKLSSVANLRMDSNDDSELVVSSQIADFFDTVAHGYTMDGKKVPDWVSALARDYFEILPHSTDKRSLYSTMNDLVQLSMQNNHLELDFSVINNLFEDERSTTAMNRIKRKISSLQGSFDHINKQMLTINHNVQLKRQRIKRLDVAKAVLKNRTNSRWSPIAKSISSKSFNKILGKETTQKRLIHSQLFRYCRNSDLAFVQRVMTEISTISGLKDYMGNSIFHIIAETGSVEVYKFFQKRFKFYELERGMINARNYERKLPLHVAIENRHVQLCEYLMADTLNLNAVDGSNTTFLMCAVGSNMPTIVEALLIRGVDMTKQDSEGNTALHHAVIFQVPDMIELLIGEKVCKIQYLNKQGYDVLHLAVLNKSYNMCEMLLKFGLDVNGHTSTGATALHLATRGGSTRIVRLLLSYGANVNLVDNFGWSVLHEAAASSKSNRKVVKRLLDAGAVVTHFDRFSHSAYEISNANTIRKCLLDATLEESANIRGIKEKLERKKTQRRNHGSNMQKVIMSNVFTEFQEDFGIAHSTFVSPSGSMSNLNVDLVLASPKVPEMTENMEKTADKRPFTPTTLPELL